MEGEYTPREMKSGVQESEREIYDYGNAGLARRFLEYVGRKLDQYTPHIEELIATAIIRVINPQPLRLHDSRWEKLYLSRESGTGLSPKRMSRILQETEQSVGMWHEIFSALITEDDLLLYDLTSVFT